MIRNFLYDLGLILLALIALPKMLFRRFYHKKYKQSFGQRWGKCFPHIEKNGCPLIWIHAVSVGETKAISTLAKHLKSEYPKAIFLISSITETGHHEAKTSLAFANYHVYLPFDFKWIIEPLVKRVAPDLVILCESDFWYNFLKAAKKSGAYVALVNGKISERSTSRFRKIPYFSRSLFALIDRYCIQNGHYYERFYSLSIPENKMLITGNLKFDDTYLHLSSNEIQSKKLLFGIQENDFVIVLGSSHYPEEELFLDCLQTLWLTFPHLKALIVPRHPERFKEVSQLIEKKGIAYHRFSDLKEPQNSSTRLFLIDAMGVLRLCYQLSTIAVVGGSFTPKVGGHNILEPCWYGKPILYGPHMHSQPELVELAKKYEVGGQVSSEELCPVLTHLLQDCDKRNQLGQAGLQLVKEMQGGTKRTLSAIQELIS